MFGIRTPLIIIPGTMTRPYYLENIINTVITPLGNESGAQFILMEDNTRPHRTRDVQQALENQIITTLEWSAMSPDINLIEHIWDYVSRAVHCRNNPPRNSQEFIVTYPGMDEYSA